MTVYSGRQTLIIFVKERYVIPRVKNAQFGYLKALSRLGMGLSKG